MTERGSRWSFLVSWDGLDSSQQVQVFVPIAIAFINIFAYLILGFSGSFLIILVASTTIYLASEKLSRFAFENEMKRKFDELRAGDRDLRFIGTGIEAIDWFYEHSNGLQSVENTVFREQYEETGFVLEKALPRFLETQRRILEEGAVWQDLAYCGFADHVRELHNTLSSEAKKRHKGWSIPVNIPLLQVLILNYQRPDRSPAILFGWNYAAGDKSAVFLSENADTVGYFRRYFSELKNAAATIDFSPTPPTPPVAEPPTLSAQASPS